MAQKVRLDQLLVQRGHFDSREKAKRTIMAGLVFINNQKFDKPGTNVDPEADIYIKENAIPFVSRGGLKLEKAIKEFKLELKDKICIDIGASTGGFTDCMLKAGACRVYAIDVGYGQLDWKLRQDPRVINMERTNIRYVTPDQIPEAASFASIDVSFISLKIVLPAAQRLLKPGAEIVALIKPQFEAGRDKVGKKGVVRDIGVHQEVVTEIIQFSRSLGFKILGCSFSPIKGPEGNIEYLLHLGHQSQKDGDFHEQQILMVIQASHESLDDKKTTR
ncbi:TlyA family RNA methyltransferase [Alkaliphilus crotonatoxidans]